MFRNEKDKLIFKVLVIFISISMATAGFSAGTNSARIIPSGKVSIIKNGKVVGQFSQEAPLPSGTMLKCHGKCAVKLDDVYMVVEPNTVFSVESTTADHSLSVQEGTVYYSMTEASRPIKFNTPAGDATTGDISLDDSELKGYVRVTENKSELGVIGGGTIFVETESGEMFVATGKNITIISDEPKPAFAATGESGSGGMSKRTQYILGSVGAGIAILGGIALAASGGGGGGSSGGGDDGSPAAP